MKVNTKLVFFLEGGQSWFSVLVANRKIQVETHEINISTDSGMEAALKHPTSPWINLPSHARENLLEKGY